MSMPVFQIYTKSGDLRDFGAVKVPTYEVNNQPLFEEWQDSLGIAHRVFVRNKIEGKFDMWFTSSNEYDSFFSILNEARDYYMRNRLIVYVNNLRLWHDGYFFVEVNPKNEEPYINLNKEHDGFTVKIEEA